MQQITSQPLSLRYSSRNSDFSQLYSLIRELRKLSIFFFVDEKVVPLTCINLHVDTSSCYIGGSAVTTLLDNIVQCNASGVKF